MRNVKKSTVNLGGRPTKKTPEVVEKLEDAFRDGAHIYEACAVAGIDRKTYWTWLKEDARFSTRMKEAQEWVTQIAKSVVAKDITKRKNVDTAKWWIERKLKNEFSLRSELTGKDGETLKVIVEEV